MAETGGKKSQMPRISVRVERLEKCKYNVIPERKTVECGYANPAPTRQKPLLAFALYPLFLFWFCFSSSATPSRFCRLSLACSFAHVMRSSRRGTCSMRAWPLYHHYHHHLFGAWARDDQPFDYPLKWVVFAPSSPSIGP